MTDLEDAYTSWLTSLHRLVSDPPRLAQWQDRRFAFAHQVGDLLTRANGRRSPVTGPVLYGVFTSGGLCYVGQTQEGERRLRDLPVGESHHVANTVPPELWESVVVLRWPELLAHISASERETASALGPVVCGLVLEHRLQVATSPPLNSRRRDSRGGWRARNHAVSRSRGAVHAASLPELWQCAWEAWTTLANLDASGSNLFRADTGVGHIVFPGALHRSRANTS